MHYEVFWYMTLSAIFKCFMCFDHSHKSLWILPNADKCDKQIITRSFTMHRRSERRREKEGTGESGQDRPPHRACSYDTTAMVMARKEGRRKGRKERQRPALSLCSSSSGSVLKMRREETTSETISQRVSDSQPNIWRVPSPPPQTTSSAPRKERRGDATLWYDMA